MPVSKEEGTHINFSVLVDPMASPGHVTIISHPANVDAIIHLMGHHAKYCGGEAVVNEAVERTNGEGFEGLSDVIGGD